MRPYSQRCLLDVFKNYLSLTPLSSGTGIQNLRECIIETKWKYDVAPEDKQVGWKALILDFMERYFYLICFATYAMQEGHGGYQKSFSSWMDDHKELRMMIGEENDKKLSQSLITSCQQIRVRISSNGTELWTLPSWSTSRT